MVRKHDAQSGEMRILRMQMRNFPTRITQKTDTMNRPYLL